MTEDRILLLLLPGADMTAADFETHDFIGAVRRRSAVEVIAVDTGIDCYLDDAIAGRLQAEIIGPARARGIERIWIAGISLGGMGALRYAEAYPGMAEGLLLLSPFIGSRGLIDKIEAAGGIARWQEPAGGEQTPEHRLIAWIRDCHAGTREWPDIRLAYGSEDRFAAAHRLLGAVLPADNVLVGPGGHDWETWARLWERLLDMKPFAYRTMAGEQR